MGWNMVQSVILGADGRPLIKGPVVEDDAIEIRAAGVATKAVAPEVDERKPKFAVEGMEVVDESDELEISAVGLQRPEAGKAVPSLFPETLLAGRFIGDGHGSYRRRGEDQPALKVDGAAIKFLDKKKDAIAAGVDLAKQMGWTAIEVKGSRRNRQALWIAAALEGIQVVGFEPKETDLKALEAARVARDFKGPAVEPQAAEQALTERVLEGGKSVVSVNYEAADYSGPVLAANDTHVAVEFNGRLGHVAVMERARLGELGTSMQVGDMVDLSFRDGQAVKARQLGGAEKGMER